MIFNISDDIPSARVIIITLRVRVTKIVVSGQRRRAIRLSAAVIIIIGTELTGTKTTLPFNHTQHFIALLTST